MRRKALFLRIAAAATLLGSVSAGAALADGLKGTLKKIKDSGSITIGHRESSVPFSYYDDQQKVVGYAQALCLKVAEAIRVDLKMDKIDIRLNPVTSATRIPLMANGTIDLECGSTTNNLERQKQVAFTYTHFVAANRILSKKASNIKKLDDLKGKSVVSTSGTSNIKQLVELNAANKLGMNIIAAKDHAEAFLTLETDRAAAFIMDDVLLASLAAGSKDPSAYVMSEDMLSVEPYGIMLRKDDLEFKAAVDAAMLAIFKSGEIKSLYETWFMKPIPPRGITLNIPMSPVLQKVFEHPTDSGDPASYK